MGGSLESWAGPKTRVSLPRPEKETAGKRSYSRRNIDQNIVYKILLIKYANIALMRI